MDLDSDFDSDDEFEFQNRAASYIQGFRVNGTLLLKNESNVFLTGHYFCTNSRCLLIMLMNDI